MRSLEWVIVILKTHERSWNTQNNLEFQEILSINKNPASSKISNINIYIIPGHFYSSFKRGKTTRSLKTSSCSVTVNSEDRRNQPVSSEEESGGDQLKQCKDPAVDGGWTYGWRRPVLSRKESAFPGLWLELRCLLPLPQGQPSFPTHPPASVSSVSSIRHSACGWGNISYQCSALRRRIHIVLTQGVQSQLLPVSALKFWRTAPGLGMAPAYLTRYILLL